VTPRDRQRRRRPGFDDDGSRSCGGKLLYRPRAAPMAGCGRGRVSPPTVAAGSGPGARRPRQLLSRAAAAAAASVPRSPSASLNVPLPPPPPPPTLLSTYLCRRYRCSSCSAPVVKTLTTTPVETTKSGPIDDNDNTT